MKPENADFFKNKTVWITGASSGIGKALALLLSRKGARLVLSGRDEFALQQVADECRVEETGNPIIYPFDMAEHSVFTDVVQSVLDATGGIDILVNNAGVGQRAAAISCEPAVVRQIMNVNFMGTVFLTQALLPSMIHSGSGRIVVVSSVLGKFHLPGRSAYAASKHALQGYFNTLRTELHGSGVGITIACPGWIATHISQNALTANGSTWCQTTGVASKKMSAEVCARHIAHAIVSQKNEATMGGIEKWGGLLRFTSPRIYERVIRKRAQEFIFKFNSRQ
jgi:dehydrogenase/reductase SDR family member 7B